MRKLGNTQLAFLRQMARTPTAPYYAGCGWIWGTRSESERIANSLTRRGLLRLEERRFPRPAGRPDRVVNYWYIIERGIEVASNKSGS